MGFTSCWGTKCALVSSEIIEVAVYRSKECGAAIYVGLTERAGALAQVLSARFFIDECRSR